MGAAVLVPTVSLIVTVLADAAIGVGNHEISRVRVRKDFYDIARWLSIFYLVMLGATIILAVVKSIYIDRDTDKSPLDTLKMSSLYLAPCQGLVVAAISRLYLSKQTQQGPAGEASVTERK